MPDICLARFDDLPAILVISNWAAKHTAANFAVEPETLQSWQQDWRDTHEMYPWFVAVDKPSPPAPLPMAEGSETLPLTPSLGGRGNVVGFAKAAPWKGRCAYHWTAEVTVYVHPDHHGQGIAASLYKALIPTLKAQGYHTLLGGITAPNPASVRLHESFGFRRVACFERVGWKFGKWHDVGYWEVVLAEQQPPPERVRPVDEVFPSDRCGG